MGQNAMSKHVDVLEWKMLSVNHRPGESHDQDFSKQLAARSHKEDGTDIREA